MTDHIIQVEDDSGDRKYFTIVPNLSLDLLNGVEYSVYSHMKRIAGDSDVTSASERYYITQTGFGTSSIRKAIKSLIEKGFIEYVGKTRGKTKPRNTYRIKNVWVKNISFYQKKEKSPRDQSTENGPGSEKNGPQETKEWSPGDPKGRTCIKEEPIKKKEESSEPIPFSLKDEIKKWEEDPKRHINIIAYYLDLRKPDIRTREQFREVVGRHMKSAKALVPFDDDQILKASRKAAEMTSGWTLETVLKVLSK